MSTLERLTAALTDRYRIERELGMGGMATVYLAHDIKHDRRVALKVLKPELAAVLGADRFVQEIKTTAALQHPHILPLFDSGAADSFLYYVMPFIDGETLRSKLDRETQLGIDESVRIATNIADALDYAHRHGVIHRDIKPENILLHEGRPMVADFGIALAVSAAAGGRMTETGLSLGTPHYMSPEQATGEKEISARSDIYSLASVLYEMLTGNPPHTGASAQQIIMKIVTEEAAPVTKLRRSVPPNVASAIAKGVEKLPADRFVSAAEFAAALADAHFTTAKADAGATLQVDASRWRKRALLAGAAATAFAAVALVGLLRPPPPLPVIRYSMGIPPGQAMRQGVLGVNIAISPDGRRIVYVGPGETGDQLWLRERDRLGATPLAGTTAAHSPYFSPDGGRIAFSAGNNVELKVIPVSGGPPITLAHPGTGSGGGGAWGRDGWIYFDTFAGLSRVPADGGTPELVIPLDSAGREAGHAWPDVLPNGKGILYRSRRDLDPGDFDIVVFDIKKRERHVLTKGLIGRYVEPGFLVYLRADGAVLAAPFDQDRMKLTGAAVPLFEGVMTKPFGSADLALSNNGTLAYVPGLASAAGGFAELVYVSRAGAVTPLNPPLTLNFNTAAPALSLSQDGRLLAVEVAAGAAAPDIWIKQLPAGPFSRLTFGGRGSGRPSWLPDARSIAYITRSDRGAQVVWKKRADGSTPAAPVWRDPGLQITDAVVSSDGQWLVFGTYKATGRDIHAVRPGRDTVSTPLLAESFDEQGATLSPNDRWLAYTSDESGQNEIYVRPFPNTTDGRWQISTRGGAAARWSRNGSELFFQSATGDFMVAQILPGSTFTAAEPRALFSLASSGLFGSEAVPFYDATPDGSQFLMARLSVVNQAPGAGQIVMVDNWHQELMAKMKAKR
ncbi:MAG: protein kinase [Tepidisphaeraceae bacterium]